MGKLEITHTSFWDCPKLKIFWEGIRGEISKTLHTHIEFDPLIFVFGVLPANLANLLNKDKEYLLKILVLIAKKMITVSWYKPLPPTINQWRERIVRVYTMEKITANLNLTTDLFKKR